MNCSRVCRKGADDRRNGKGSFYLKVLSFKRAWTLLVSLVFLLAARGTSIATVTFTLGRAKAANVYWHVSTSATSGTNSVFNGNTLADQWIALNSGATLDGRALTRIGAVSLAANLVTVPAP